MTHAEDVLRPDRPGDVVVVDAPAPGAFGLLPGTVELVQEGAAPRSVHVLVWGESLEIKLPAGASGMLRIVPAAPLKPFETPL